MTPTDAAATALGTSLLPALWALLEAHAGRQAIEHDVRGDGGDGCGAHDSGLRSAFAARKGCGAADDDPVHFRPPTRPPFRNE